MKKINLLSDDNKDIVLNSSKMTSWSLLIVIIDAILIVILSALSGFYLVQNPLDGVLVLILNIVTIYFLIQVTDGNNIYLLTNTIILLVIFILITVFLGVMGFFGALVSILTTLVFLVDIVVFFILIYTMKKLDLVIEENKKHGLNPSKKDIWSYPIILIIFLVDAFIIFVVGFYLMFFSIGPLSINQLVGLSLLLVDILVILLLIQVVKGSRSALLVNSTVILVMLFTDTMPFLTS